MRDVLEKLFAQQPLDPNEAARRAMRPQLPARFYKAAGIAETDAGYQIELDGRPAKTPGRNMLAAPNRAIAEALHAEWNAQANRIDPATMPLTRLVNSIIDGVAAASWPVIEEVAKYLASDLVCYRAESPEGLAIRQAKHWDPIVAWAREELHARFILASSVMFVVQPDTTIASARAAIPDDPWRLGAVHAITTLTGSALVALAMLRGKFAAEQAWAAAHVDEDWNMETWGRDEIALARREFRLTEFQAAACVLASFA